MMFVKCKECFGLHYQCDALELKNIEEDAHTGADVLTYICPETNRVTSSIILVENQ
jgi:hypothetical protein